MTRSESFFHGSTSHMEPGEHIVPGAELGRANYEYEHLSQGAERRKNVFGTDKEGGAWWWGHAGSGAWANHNRERNVDGKLTRRRVAVYEGEPTGEVKRGEFDSDDELTTRDAVRVTKRHDIPPYSVARSMESEAGHDDNFTIDHASKSVQGTLPMANWNVHRSLNRKRYNEAEEQSQRMDKAHAERMAERHGNPRQLRMF